jgi:hypothetical protein
MIPKDVFSEHEIRVFFEHGLVSCPDISYFLDLRQTKGAKKIPKPFWKPNSKPKKPRIHTLNL